MTGLSRIDCGWVALLRRRSQERVLLRRIRFQFADAHDLAEAVHAIRLFQNHRRVHRQRIQIVNVRWSEPDERSWKANGIEASADDLTGRTDGERGEFIVRVRRGQGLHAAPGGPEKSHERVRGYRTAYYFPRRINAEPGR